MTVRLFRHRRKGNPVVNLSEIEQKVVDAIHAVVNEAAANEPSIDVAVHDALTAAGAPEPVSAAVQSAIGALLNHFAEDSAAKKAAEQAAAEAQPA